MQNCTIVAEKKNEARGGYNPVMISRCRRSCALALAAALLAPSGCVSQKRYAEERRVLIDIGMSGDEVRSLIGKPWRIMPVATAAGVAEQTVEVWAYALNPGPHPAEAAVGLVRVAGVLFLVAAGGGGGGSADLFKGFSSSGGGGSSARADECAG
jgi:hypothetical protein